MEIFKRYTFYFPLAFFLSITILITQLNVLAEGSNSFGIGLSWLYCSANRTLKISASSQYNRMPDYFEPKYAVSPLDIPPWESVKNDAETIIIESGVSNIGNYAFSDFKSLKTAVIGDTLTAVGEGAFLNCSSLTTVNLPDVVKSINDCAFSNCSSLKQFDFPADLAYIGASAFDNCSSLKQISIPLQVATIQPLAFAGCSGLEQIKVVAGNNNFSAVGNCLIDNNKKALLCGCKNSVIPCDGTVIKILPYAFYNFTSLKRINIPNISHNTFIIGDHAFYGCDSLKDVSFYGNESEWNAILSFNTDNYNEPLKNADCSYYGFKDVMLNAWYANAIQYVSCNKLITGYNSSVFGASDCLQRQDAVVILSRLSKSDLAAYGNTSPFFDVPKNQYYTSAIVWGKRNGIVNGYMNGKFGVGDKVTREQFLCFLYRYANHMGLDTSLTVNKNYYAAKYIDFGSISPYAVDAVCWALEKGIISGRTSNTIAPLGYALRSEIAQIFFNIYKNDLL